MTANLRELLKDERVAAVRARVDLHEDHRQSHYDINEEGHLIISVLTLQHEVPIWVELSGGFGGGNGLWTIPAIGTEVMVVFDDGDFEGDGAAFPVGDEAPADLTPGKVFLLADEIHIRTPGGTAVKVATLADVQAIQTALHNHGHTYIPGSSGSATTTGNPSVPAPTGTTKTFLE